MMRLNRVLVLFLGFLWHPGRAQVVDSIYALTGVTIIDALHPVPVAHPTLLISRTRITDIFTDGSIPLPDTVRIVRMDGKYVVPGLLEFLLPKAKLYWNLATENSL